jgi:hypothetical protein
MIILNELEKENNLIMDAQPNGSLGQTISYAILVLNTNAMHFDFDVVDIAAAAMKD